MPCFRIAIRGLCVFGGLIFTLCATLSCSSLHKDAEVLMNGEAYEEAAKVYAQILVETPNDARAIVGQKKARTQWIDKALIDVRMLRLAGQAASATELLKKIITGEDQWQFYPIGAVQFTQDEETGYAVQFIAAQVTAWHEKNHLLKARAYLNGYRQLFTTPTLTTTLNDMHRELYQTATSKCGVFQRGGLTPQPYSMAYAKRYCDAWGMTFDPGFDVSRVRATALFKKLEIVINAAPTLLESVLVYEREQMRKKFESSAWFDPEATESLFVGAVNAFTHNHTKDAEAAIHSYSVQVPYTVEVPMTRTIPHTQYRQSCQYICSDTGYSCRNQCQNVPYTTYTYEHYTVPTTQYRNEPRFFEYRRWRHTQSLAFHAQIRSVMHEIEADISHENAVNQTDTEHSESAPEVGLTPDPLTLADPLKWLEKEIRVAAGKWGDALGRGWIQRYCKNPDSTVDQQMLMEHVLRCLRAPPDPMPSFVGAWFQETMGADYETVEGWLNRVDNGPLPLPDR